MREVRMTERGRVPADSRQRGGAWQGLRPQQTPGRAVVPLAGACLCSQVAQR